MLVHKKQPRRRRGRGDEAHKFSSEAELCELFTAWARDNGYRVYAELENYDLVLVRERDGAVIGVQAKLRANMDVLAQAKTSWFAKKGPDYHAVLVPTASNNFLTLANVLRLGVMQHTRLRGQDFWLGNLTAHRHSYPSPLWIPDLDYTMPAGTAAPVRLTKWKLTALRLCIHFEANGGGTARDFAEFGLDITRWVRQGWIVSTGKKDKDVSGATRYVLGGTNPLTLYPEVAKSVREAVGRGAELSVFAPRVKKK